MVMDYPSWTEACETFAEKLLLELRPLLPDVKLARHGRDVEGPDQLEIKVDAEKAPTWASTRKGEQWRPSRVKVKGGYPYRAVSLPVDSLGEKVNVKRIAEHCRKYLEHRKAKREREELNDRKVSDMGERLEKALGIPLDEEVKRLSMSLQLDTIWIKVHNTGVSVDGLHIKAGMFQPESVPAVIELIRAFESGTKAIRAAEHEAGETQDHMVQEEVENVDP